MVGSHCNCALYELRKKEMDRSEIKYNFKRFSLDDVIRRILRTIIGRRNIDDRLLDNRKVPFIKDLCSMFLAVTRKYFPIDNG